MDLGLTDKCFIVSGSSRGIGKGIASILLDEGAKVVLCGRDESSLSNTFNELDSRHQGQVFQVQGDITIPATLQAMDELLEREHLPLFGLVANAGAVKPVEDIHIDNADWQWYFHANLYVAEALINHFCDRLIPTRGNIVIINSIAGLEEIGAPLPYSASKAALNSYAKGLSKRLARRKVRVNTVSPGNVLFEGGNWANRLEKDRQSVQAMIENNVPLNCFGEVQDIGNAVAFLASDKAKFITGSNLVVDGGQTIFL